MLWPLGGGRRQEPAATRLRPPPVASLAAVGARHPGGDRLPLPTSVPHSVATGFRLAAASYATACPARKRGRRKKWTPRRTAWPSSAAQGEMPYLLQRLLL